MGNAKNKDVKLELLLATMNRDSLDFLAEIFPYSNYKNHSILIINQSEVNALVSNLPNIRVINSQEKGLAKSRNLAIKNAVGEVCLLVDDDVKFKPDFESIILETYNTNKEAEIITFMLEDFEERLFKNYPDVKHHNLESIKEVNSVVISFKREKIAKSNLLFNTLFGLGATFETADEYIFMRDALALKLNTLFEPKVILSHPKFSSGQDNGSDTLVFARSALYYKYSGFLGYLKLFKYLFLITKEGYIDSSQFIQKFKIGLKGIQKFKSLKKKNIHDYN